MLLPLLYFEATEAVLLYLVSGVALKVETSRWLSSGKLVAPKEDNIHIYTSFLIPISNSENIYETAIFDKDLVPSYNAKIKIAITLLKFILLQFSTL